MVGESGEGSSPAELLGALLLVAAEDAGEVKAGAGNALLLLDLAEGRSERAQEGVVVVGVSGWVRCKCRGG